MVDKAGFSLKKRNPDVLTCIANLSNDEVFTPPEFAKQMLDTLEKAWADANNGANIWADKTVTFLDPCTKSGVFLREIVERLSTGLESQIPDLRKRVDHILTKQVFGIGITHLTSLLARRSVYCSKFANGEHSVATSFDNENGNIWFESMQHTWVGGNQIIETADEDGNPIQKKINGRCKFCGASQREFDRDASLETHAYAFIHAENVKNFVASTFGDEMQFDVIIGNPPYQLDDGGFGTSAGAIYNKFVEQAKRLEPRYLSMVIPARWFAGGKGLDDFRTSMLQDTRIRVIEDFPDSNDVFPGTQIKSGVCYFLWCRDERGLCRVTTHDKGVVGKSVSRPLLEPGMDVFVRFNEALPILRKMLLVVNGSDDVIQLEESKQFSRIVSSSKPFGFRTFFQGTEAKTKNSITLFQNGGVGYVSRNEIEKGQEYLDNWKVFIPAAGSGSDSFPHPILGKPFVGPPDSACTETYMCIGPLKSQTEAENVISYIRTRFFRFLVLLHKPSQHATRSVYTYVPMEDFSKPWTDEKLYKKYGITEDEIAFIESMIRPMELDNE